MRTLLHFILPVLFCIGSSTAQMSSEQLRNFNPEDVANANWIQESYKDSLMAWQEKVYLHLSNDLVPKKSQLFFKCYLVTGPQKSRFNLSNVLKVELINENGQVVRRQYHPIEDGMARGNMDIPKKIDDGKYYLRAYTRWMQNYGEETYAKKPVYIGNTSRPEKLTDSSSRKVQIFPEGGQLIAGEFNRLVMRISPYDKNLSKVEITDQSGKVVGRLTSFPNGLYTAIFKPVSGKEYSIKMSDGRLYPIPNALEQGYLLKVNNLDPERTKIKIVATPGISNHELKLIGEVDGIRYLEKDVELSSKSYVDFEFLKEGIPRGVMILKLIDDAGTELLKRPVWIDGARLNIELIPLKSYTEQSDELAFQLKVFDGENNAVQTELALGITEMDEIPISMSNQEANYGEFFLLSPNEDLDMGSIDQESRGLRFYQDIQIIARANSPKQLKSRDFKAENGIQYPIQTGLELVGYTYDMDNKILANTVIQLMAFSEGSIWVQDLKTDPDGLLIINDLQLEGETDLVFRTSGESTKERLVRFIPATGKVSNTARSLSKTIEAKKEKRIFEPSSFEVQDTTGLIALKEVVVREKAPEKITNPSLYNIEPDRVQYQNPERPKTLPELLMNIPGVNVSGLGTLYPIVSLPARAGAGPILWVVDGFPLDQSRDSSLAGFSRVSNLAEIISMVPATDVERIELLMGPSAAIFGTRGAGGVFLIYTRSGSDVDRSMRKEAQMVFEGYTPVLEFEDYDRERSKKARESSKTIYWNASLKTSEDGTTVVRIPKPENDLPIKIQVSTVTDDGKVGLYNATLTE